MKKIIALVIAIVMMAAISVPAFAHVVDGEHVDETAPSASEITAKYVLDEAWEITLPSADIVVGAANTATITIANVKIDWDRQLDVTVDSTNDWKLKNVDTGLKADGEGAAPSITYKATYAGGDVSETSVLATAKATAIGTVEITNGELSFALVDTVLVAGDYADTLTFTVAVNTIDARHS